MKDRLCSTIDVTLFSVICSLLLPCVSDMTCRNMQHSEIGQNSQEQVQARVYSYILFYNAAQS